VEPNVEMLEYIDKNFKKCILCGDLNSKHETFGAQSSNSNGKKLNECFEKTRAVSLNNKDYTYFQTWRAYKEMLDLWFCSNNVYKSILKMDVLKNRNLDSDHFPTQINLQPKVFKKSETTSIPYKYDKLG
jgi:endonuclease/exonuclease/phosphatase family metal-dependent hydrolase